MASIRGITQKPSEISDEDKRRIANTVRDNIEENLTFVMETLAEKEGRKGDSKCIDKLMQIYGKETRLLAYRILDELLLKE